METHDETDLNDVGSNDEVERVKRQVGQDYGQGLGQRHYYPLEWLKDVPNDPAGLHQDVFNLYIK